MLAQGILMLKLDIETMMALARKRGGRSVQLSMSTLRSLCSGNAQVATSGTRSSEHPKRNLVSRLCGCKAANARTDE